MSVSIVLQNPSNFKDLPEKGDLQKWCEAGLEGFDSETISIVIRVVDIDESAELNLGFRDKDGPTNILSFPDELPDFIAQLPEIKLQTKHLGDLIICEPIVRQEASQQNKTLEQHWAHLIIHGMLHLQGYDHIKEKDANVMENLEIKLMKRLGFDNPY
jgi:probable rRNA maturation factor